MANGIVLYSDGGAAPTNPGPAGWGFHGYLFDYEKPTKGSGNPGHVLTTRGYVDKAEFKTGKVSADEVTPVHYFDGFGTVGAKLSNNVAELKAATEAFRHAANYDVTSVLVITDSEYTTKGLNEWAGRWVQNKWTKPNGEPVANASLWIELLKARDALVDRGVKVETCWIKGHNDHLGNEIADEWATCGVNYARRGESHHRVITSVAQSYWNFEVERHPFINHRRIYFNSLKELCRSGEYFLGEHGTDDELGGKRISDGALAVVRLTTPEPVIELLRDRVTSMADGEDSLIFGRIDKLYSRKANKLILELGGDAMVRPRHDRLDLEFLDEDPLAREQRPPRITWRIVDELIGLADQLDLYLSDKGHATQVLTDLTPILYETTIKAEKGGATKVHTKLRSEFNVGYAALETPASYRDGNEIKTANVKLMLGIDILDRNSLKRLEEMSPKITLVTWPAGDGIFRYATIVESGSDVGIWAGVYSNVRVVP